MKGSVCPSKFTFMLLFQSLVYFVQKSNATRKCYSHLNKIDVKPEWWHSKHVLLPFWYKMTIIFNSFFLFGNINIGLDKLSIYTIDLFFYCTLIEKICFSKIVVYIWNNWIMWNCIRHDLVFWNQCCLHFHS